MTIGGQSITKASRMFPTGESCTVGEIPEPATGQQDACVQQGTLTQCLRDDGQHCTSASNGKQFCWPPGENGIRTSGNEAASKIPEGAASKLPPVAPTNGGDWQQIGQAQVTHTTTVNNQTTTNNSTINHYNSTYGNAGGNASGGGAVGDKGGTGSGSGNGSGNGNGDGDGDGDGPGSPGGQLGDLYTSDGKTVAGVFQA
ncbi:MAG TPA: hypothetical protein VIG82_06210, partial [Enteractinococcus sp.]